MPQGRPIKEFQDYLVQANHTHSSQADYLRCPATAFLKHTVEAKSAIDLIIRNLPKKQNGEYTTDSRDTLQHLIIATLPTIIGHFETFQRHLFAGTFELSVMLENFDPETFAKNLNSHFRVSINLLNLCSYRASGTAPVGRLIADNLPGWHDPEKVNKYFKLFFKDLNLFSGENCIKLKTLYQLRHSIVHTGGTLTLPDSQKVEALKNKGGLQISFEKNFIFEVSRKLHPLVKEVLSRLKEKFDNNLRADLSSEEINQKEQFYKVSSSVAVWLK